MSLAASRIHVTTRPDTLYDALGVDETVSPRKVRKIAKAIRRDATTAEDFLHDVCLAEEVLGDPVAREEYNRLLARVRAAGLPHPKIGVAIEGARLAPSLAARVGGTTLAGARVIGDVLKAIAAFGFAIGMLILIAIGIGSKGSSGVSGYEYKPIKIPEFQMPKFDPPQIDYSKLYVPPPMPKIDYQAPRLDLRQFDSLDKPKPRPKRTPKTAPKTPKTPKVESTLSPVGDQ